MNIRILFLCTCLLYMHPMNAVMRAPGTWVRAMATAADSVPYSKTIGPLVIKYMTFNKGYSVNCSLLFANQIVGLKTMTAYDAQYKFDVLIGTYGAKGTMYVLFMPQGQYSTLNTDLFFSSDMLRKDSAYNFQHFRGFVGAWLTSP
jgi:hypothetical protein